MSTSGTIVLTAIIIAFLIFGVVLAWGERQTRNLATARKSGENRRETAEALLRSAKAIGMTDSSAVNDDRKLAKS